MVHELYFVVIGQFCTVEYVMVLAYQWGHLWYGIHVWYCKYCINGVPIWYGIHIWYGMV